MHPDLEGDKENLQQVYSQRELISLVYNAMQALINQRKSVKKVAIWWMNKPSHIKYYIIL